ncbi:MAG: hypothetical protein AB1776_07205 [Bacillota bacterium]
MDALRIVVESMVWPTEQVTPEEAAEIEEELAEIDAGKGVKAEDVRKDPGRVARNPGR